MNDRKIITIIAVSYITVILSAMLVTQYASGTVFQSFFQKLIEIIEGQPMHFNGTGYEEVTTHYNTNPLNVTNTTTK